MKNIAMLAFFVVGSAYGTGLSLPEYGSVRESMPGLKWKANPESKLARQADPGKIQMSVVADFVGNLGEKEDPTVERFDFREIEFGFASDVDPFLRAEAYIALAKEDGETVVEVEEIFGKYTGLGHGLSAKVGKIAGAVGRVQRNHGDQLDYLEYPMVVQDVLGDEGLRRPGGSISYLFPSTQFRELTFEVLEPDTESPLFNRTDKDSPIFLGHFRTFFDFNEDLSAQLGFSGGTGPSLGDNTASLYGVDFTMKWRPGEKGKSANFEGEAIWSDAGGSAERTFGAFARATYEVAPRFFVTAGYDYSELPGSSDIRGGVLAGLTFAPTEFQKWRIEWQRIHSNFESSRNVLNIQFQWLIGAHPAHKY